jgi:hypothetical protein
MGDDDQLLWEVPEYSLANLVADFWEVLGLLLATIAVYVWDKVC